MKHRTRIETLPDGRFRWICSCKQYGDPWKDRAEAKRWAEEHLQEVPERV